MSETEEVKKFKSILFDYKHDNLAEAILADIVDVVPWLGDIANAERTRRARNAGNESAFKLQLVDTVAGSVPYFGDFFDIITPSNTIIFLNEKSNLKMPLPIEDLATLLKNANNWIRKQ